MFKKMSIQGRSASGRKVGKKFIISLIFVISLFFVSNIAFAQYEYTPKEGIPGSSAPADFPAYVEAIFKFAIWAIGIAAMMMISVGGFMYFTSAGNTSKLGKAKDVIRDALFGLIAIMVAYLVLYVINPDLVRINLDLGELEVEPSSTTTTPSGTITNPDGTITDPDTGETSDPDISGA